MVDALYSLALSANVQLSSVLLSLNATSAEAAQLVNDCSGHLQCMHIGFFRNVRFCFVMACHILYI